ncbi:MAG TPA: hypothetical protein VGA45_03505 [Actinomycetota bacterium]
MVSARSDPAGGCPALAVAFGAAVAGSQQPGDAQAAAGQRRPAHQISA